ncbi:MAG: S-methyl-5-thioribose-1-phosphate isomerase [Fibrobacterota bacterium]
MKIGNNEYRTVWAREYRGERVVTVIDQSCLPHSFSTIDLHTVADYCDVIKNMKIRGAGCIGAVAAYGMYQAARQADPTHYEDDLKTFAEALLATRPTASNLAWAVKRMQGVIDAAHTSSEAMENAFTEAEAIADEDVAMCRAIGSHGVEIIGDISRRKRGEPVNILTHCNAGWLAFVDYGSATAPIYEAHRRGIPVHVWVDETRPRNQGARLTAWELSQEGVPHTIIPDNTGGHLMQHGMVDMVITGTDRVTRRGDVANKIGTYLKALAATHNSIPFYVALPSSTFDFAVSNGLREIPIEQRGEEEVKYVRGRTDSGAVESVLICPEESPAANWGFDVTPAELITALICERGIVRPDEDSITGMFPEAVHA